MENSRLAKSLRKVCAELMAIIDELEVSNPEEKHVRLTLIRQLVILTLVFKAGGVVKPEEISAFARRVGRTPGSTSGFYAGTAPLMARAGESGELRKLTERGQELVRKHMELWGENWLEVLMADPIFAEISNPKLSEKSLFQIP